MQTGSEMVRPEVLTGSDVFALETLVHGEVPELLVALLEVLEDPHGGNLRQLRHLRHVTSL